LPYKIEGRPACRSSGREKAPVQPGAFKWIAEPNLRRIHPKIRLSAALRYPNIRWTSRLTNKEFTSDPPKTE
jgi:hypothetical protein